jgi:hypothetical protein
MTAIGLVLLFLLTQATNNRELYERNYARLFGRQHGGGRAAAAGHRLDHRAAVLAAAPQALRQPAAAQAGRHFCAGRVSRPAC